MTTSPRALQLSQVEILPGFWHDRLTTNRERTLPAVHAKLKATGRLDAWRREVPNDQLQRHIFWDSDTAKWIEAVGYTLTAGRDATLEAQVDEVIDWMSQIQESDGYLNSYFSIVEPDARWTNLRDRHELYCAGHLMEAAVAYSRATGKRALLDLLCRYTDHIAATFGPGPGQRRGYCGHPEVELALIKLAEATDSPHYLDLARFFVDERGRAPHYFDLEAQARGEDPRGFWAKTYHYCQAHVPVRDQKIATGHSVRAAYLYTAMAALARLTGDAALADSCRAIWTDLTAHQMYITGGVGPAHANEGFTFAYDLPNETAYGETCASIALVLWAQQMFELDGQGAYIDVLERALYNNVLAGVSAEGDHFFYANPLASYPHISPYAHWSGIHTDRHYRRSDWFGCACCPPNVARLLASVGQYLYAATDDTLFANLYGASRVHTTLGGSDVVLEQRTDYPWAGAVQLELRSAAPAAFQLALRVPGWCRRFTLAVNGAAVDAPVVAGYVRVTRTWSPGDVVTLDLAMPIERMRAHPEVRQDAHQIALQRGPVVYCVEEVDNGPRLANLALPAEAALAAGRDPGLFGGLGVITGEALRVEPAAWPGGLYQAESTLTSEARPQPFRAIPYAFWANRAPGEMRVWLAAA
ncbi:MAG: glycoside hydrolase family 127 protein [Anaerolineales bacterium]|nr:glycoside hydrolase family 127 protein [Anaerolineales bacterium]